MGLESWRLQDCVDDDVAFKEEAAKASLPPVESCSEAVGLAASTEAFCLDEALNQVAGEPMGA